MKLPILVTVPHGGQQIPPEADSCLLTAREIAEDADTWARSLFDLREDVLVLVDTPVPRAIVDLNRSPDDLPPANPDGVVKTVTVDGTQVWPDPRGPDPGLAWILLDRYHRPWHETVAAESLSPGLMLGLDCHTMLATGAPGHAMAGEARPLICLGNRGDSRGRSAGEKLTAPTDLARLLLDSLTLELRNEDAELEITPPRFRLNDPFRGGFISRTHASRGPIPWIQLEISRALYLPERFGTEPGAADAHRLADLRRKLLSALRRTL